MACRLFISVANLLLFLFSEEILFIPEQNGGKTK